MFSVTLTVVFVNRDTMSCDISISQKLLAISTGTQTHQCTAKENAHRHTGQGGRGGTHSKRTNTMSISTVGNKKGEKAVATHTKNNKRKEKVTGHKPTCHGHFESVLRFHEYKAEGHEET